MVVAFFKKHVVKPLSGSAPSVRVSALGPLEDGAGGGAVGATGASDGKPPGKARQKKFQRHFPQVGPDERVLNYYSCALVGDLLLQGHLYITKNYFAFYSNVFGYVTKLLIPTTSVLRITKEKVARIIPNAVGVCTRDERHVFGSLLSRDTTYKLMTHVWKAARLPELAVPPPQELRSSEVELEASEYSPEDDSSSVGADQTDAPTRDPADPLITSGGVGGVGGAVGVGVGAAVIQPALLTGGASARGGARGWQAALAFAAALLALSAAYLAYRLAHAEEPARLASGGQLYAALVAWRSRLHGRAADELHAFLSTNLLLLARVRQSLETLSGVILTDMGHDVPNDTAFS
ncbi:GRAM domain-containing protein 1B [Papilio xuthus]|uniref:GRAM domain-containing protein 1B n=1 Tax=Papilio xuthus TaxID=66420 RepID=A0A194Q267_PAPXU|nr:GRAM domain-containing protein 1B [Papilio xuthus]